MTVPVSTHFKETKTPSGRKAIEAWCAVWEEGGGAVCAPNVEALNVEALKKLWRKMTGTELPSPEEAQLVWIVRV